MEAAFDLVRSPNETRQTSEVVVPPVSVTMPEAPARLHRIETLEIPAYLRDVYHWAYLNPRNVRLLDREIVVKTILWGQHRRLRESALAELEPGQTVLQPACVYGEFSPALARSLGPRGRLDVVAWLPAL